MAGNLRIKHLAVDSLVPYARNARTHSEAQVAQIAASIDEFGWTNPVLTDADGGIIAGHGRVLAAQMLGIAKVPCIELAHLTETQRRAYVIADNKLALNAGWDEQLLAAELIDLEALDFDLGLIGFDPDEVTALVAARNPGLTDPDEAPGLPAVPASAPGDLWALGRHRVLCGDSTVATDVERSLGGIEPHLMVTDPPYGVEYDPDWRNQAGRALDGSTQRLNTGKVPDRKPLGARAVGKVLNDDCADWREAWALFPGSVAYVWHAGLHAPAVMESLAECKFNVRAQIIWVKTRPVISRGHYNFQHEAAFYVQKAGKKDGWRFSHEHEVSVYAVKMGATADWNGGFKQSSVWFIEHLKSDTGHGTQKPVECMRRPIVNNSSPGQAIYDPFLGSGTTIIAAEMEGRHCLGLELDPGYVDVIVKRWQEFVGKDATLEGDGRTFNEVSHERQKAGPKSPKTGPGKSGQASGKQARAKAGRRAATPA